MQVNQNLLDLAQRNLRQCNWKVSMSFDKTFLSSLSFFTIGTSLIGGTDIIPGSGNVVQEWDKYNYVDYSSRVIAVDNITRELDPVFSTSMATADVIMNNYDDFFTPGSSSSIASNVLPGRPIRIYMGFGSELVQCFVGLTDGMPSIDQQAKTATFHCIDFLSKLSTVTLDTLALQTNVRTDQALTSIFQLAGLSSTQLNFDVGFNYLPYFWIDKGTQLITVVNQLMEAEQGRLYMDEQGIITFKNRQNYSNTPVFSFDAYNNIVDYQKRQYTDITNEAQITSALRNVQANQNIWQSTVPVLIPGGGTANIWADFADPVTAIDTPQNISVATTSSFTANSSSDGTGTPDTTAVTLTGGTLFSTSYLMTFMNSSGAGLYVTAVTLFGTPFKQYDTLYVDYLDATSQTKYGVQLLQIDNDYFQDQSQALSKATVLVTDYKDLGDLNEITVKGTPALQLDDPLAVNVFGRSGTYRITKIVESMKNNQFGQILQIKAFTPQSYFTIGISLIGGTDKISP